MKKRFCAIFMAMLLLFVTIVPAVPTEAASLAMNKNSVTIEIGDTYPLSVQAGGKKVQAQAWGSSNNSVATVDQNGLVTGRGKGSAVITAMVNGSSVECLVSVVAKTTEEITRYNVLILDVSGSVRGKALKREKEAAKRFCKTVLQGAGNNYLALVTLSDAGKVACNFTRDYGQIAKAINQMKAKGGTNMNQAFQKVDGLLSGVKSGSRVIKNVVLCSDGLPENGARAAKGRYKAKNHKFYKYANAVYKTDVKLKQKNYFIYALGFFHNSEGKDLKFGKKLMRDLASKNRYYVVTKPKDIDKVFKKIANKIKKTTKNEKQDIPKKKKTKDAISLNRSEITIYVGQSVKLKANVKGKSKKVKWSSSKKGIASVNEKGKVKGKSVGRTVITAKANGKKATCVVNVIVHHPTYSQYFMVKKQKSRYGQEKINEYGIRLVTNDGAIIRKCAVYVKKNPDGTYLRTMACTGENITYAYFIPYLSRDGKIIYEGGKTSGINTLSMRKGYDGVWSRYGNYGLVSADLRDAYGNQLAVKSSGISGENTRIFDNLDAMKTWLRE